MNKEHKLQLSADCIALYANFSINLVGRGPGQAFVRI